MHGTVDRRYGAAFYRCARSRSEYERIDCDCWRLSMRVVDTTVIHALDTLFTDPTGLATAAGVHPATNIGWADLLRRSVARQHHRLLFDLETFLNPHHDNNDDHDDPAILERGDPLVVDHELMRRNARLIWSRRRLARAQANWSTIERTVDRYQQLRTGPPRRTLDHFDVKVGFVSGVSCQRCNSSGVLRPPSSEGRTAGAVGQVCPDCDRYRSLPILNITARIAHEWRLDVPPPHTPPPDTPRAHTPPQG